MISAIVLAAGESRRMGRLKPLIKINNKTFLQHITDELRIAGISDIVVVVGFEADRIKQESGLSQIQFAVNKNYENGQFSSLQTGIRHLDKKCEAVLVCLGDQPQIRADWITRLVQVFGETRAPIVSPKFRVKRGHPILFSADLFDEILAMHPTQAAFDLKRAHKEEIVDVPIDDEGLIVDADTPDDLELVRRFFDR